MTTENEIIQPYLERIRNSNVYDLNLKTILDLLQNCDLIYVSAVLRNLGYNPEVLIEKWRKNEL
jgi:hypothetical protein